MCVCRKPVCLNILQLLFKNVTIVKWSSALFLLLDTMLSAQLSGGLIRLGLLVNSNVRRRASRIDIVFHLFWQGKVEDHADDGSNGKTGLHYEGDGIQKSLKRAVVALVGENLVKVVGDKSSSKTQSEASGKDEAVATGKGHATGDDRHARDGDGAEEEGSHATEDSGGNGDKRGGELGKDTHDDEEHGASKTSLAVGTTGKDDNTVVLGEDGHGSHGHERANTTSKTVRENTALDTGFVRLSGNFESRDIAGGCNIADRFGGANEINGHEREDERTVNRERECVNPGERGHRGSVDAGSIKVTASSSNNATRQQSDNHRGGLHDRRTESFAQDNGQEDGETQAQELCRSPGERVRRVNIRAHSEQSLGSSHADSAAAHPVRETRLDELDTNEHDRGASDNWGKHPQQELGGNE